MSVDWGLNRLNNVEPKITEDNNGCVISDSNMVSVTHGNKIIRGERISWGNHQSHKPEHVPWIIHGMRINVALFLDNPD